ncbi:glycosyltransferase 61 family protein [Rhizosaccharibacter radicis]|uniref:Glycosyltransferase 61 family protein n=1 Tax=Rhizosaccharibacter radicis TaxID=2782605 RepID=A0ABT1W1P0_9PROT|nr:glycosyltransferase 61 family protein [Acetobacteraceae bacterium KSS12]
MSLIECNDVHGPVTVIDGDPSVLHLRDVLYVPSNGSHGPFGLFDAGRRLIQQSAYFRGPSSGTPEMIVRTTIDYAPTLRRLPDADYVYIGFVHGHYGHFLLSTLSRLWNIEDLLRSDTRIIYHANESLEDLFAVPYFKAICDVLALEPARFLRLDEPCILPTVTVPCCAFEETGYAHRVFARFTNAIGNRLCPRATTTPVDRPAYLSKSRLRSGVGHLVNEDALTEILARQGVDILYPEELSLAEQIAVFQQRPIVAGLTGSALHTSLFAPGRQLLGLSYTNTLLSSYPLIDGINGGTGTYLYPPAGIALEPRDHTFHLNYRLTDPADIASALLRAIEFAHRGMTPRSDGLTNLALRRPTRQSSTSETDRPRDPSASATSGRLTGRYQFHTNHEDDPWWSVDLGRPCHIHEIRLHNRADNSGERLDFFVLESSMEGEHWTPFHEQSNAVMFSGGIAGAPFYLRLRHDVLARFVRLSLRGRNFLHLDQVEIIGRDQARTGSSLQPQRAQPGPPGMVKRIFGWARP